MSSLEKFFIALIVVLGVLTLIFGGYYVSRSMFGRSAARPAASGAADGSRSATEKPGSPPSPDGSKSISAPDAQKHPAVPQNPPPVTPPLVPPGRVALSGKVVGKDGQPLQGVAVEAYGRDGRSAARVFALENGQFSFEALAPGDYRLILSSAGYATVMREQISIAADRPRDMGAVTLTEATGVEVLVLDAAGRFVEGAAVSVFFCTRSRPMGLEQRQLIRTEKTDAYGRVMLHDLSDGVYRFKTFLDGFKEDERGPVRLVKGKSSDSNIRSILVPVQQ